MIGEIKGYGSTIVPVNHLPCDGSTRLIEDYPELAEVLDDTFGGDGTTTFGLPDLVHRMPRGSDSSSIGIQGGNDIRDTADFLHNHAHTRAPNASTERATNSTPAVGSVIADSGDDMFTEPGTPPDVIMGSSSTGGVALPTSDTVSVVPSYTGIAYIIQAV